jgi:hypothetical protein
MKEKGRSEDQGEAQKMTFTIPVVSKPRFVVDGYNHTNMKHDSTASAPG